MLWRVHSTWSTRNLKRVGKIERQKKWQCHKEKGSRKSWKIEIRNKKEVKQNFPRCFQILSNVSLILGFVEDCSILKMAIILKWGQIVIKLVTKGIHRGQGQSTKDKGINFWAQKVANEAHALFSQPRPAATLAFHTAVTLPYFSIQNGKQMKETKPSKLSQAKWIWTDSSNPLNHPQAAVLES